MRKAYLDNIRWFTVVVVVFYHVFYMYNAEGILGPLGKITTLDVQYYDIFQYIVYPWIMMLLFIVSGASSRYALENQSGKEFIKSRTTKLLVPVTVGLFAFQFIQGYINISFSGMADSPDMPLAGKVFACILSGIGVLWYLQVLWLFSLLVVLIKKVDKDRLWTLCVKTPLWLLILFGALIFASGQILNTPIIAVYRFGLYFVAFILGYFVFSHDEVIEKTKKFFPMFLVLAVGLGCALCIRYFGENYADKPVNRSVLFLLYGWFASLSVIGMFARFFDFENSFTLWMKKRSWGLYIFHYLGISSVALFVAKPSILPPWVCYLLSSLAAFAVSYVLDLVISHLPFFRWAVLGIKKKRKEQRVS